MTKKQAETIKRLDKLENVLFRVRPSSFPFLFGSEEYCVIADIYDEIKALSETQHKLDEQAKRFETILKNKKDINEKPLFKVGDKVFYLLKLSEGMGTLVSGLVISERDENYQYKVALDDGKTIKTVDELELAEANKKSK